MKKLLLIPVCMILAAVPSRPATADDGEEVRVWVRPAKYVTVNGDVNKFSAHRWMNDGFSFGGGLEFEKKYEDESYWTFEGHTLSEDNDNDAKLRYFNKDVGTADFEYKSFRKYYDNTGGYYYPFSTNSFVDLNRNLELDMENILFAFSPSFWDLRGVTFLYERRVKDGEKSRLTWATVREGGVSRNISPSWQSVDEKVDVFALQGETTIAGFNVKAEERYERMDVSSVRHERWVSSAGGAADNKQRRQTQKPKSEAWSTTLQGDRWFSDDAAYLNLAYRYTSIDNEELENIIELNAAGVPTNFNNPKHIVNALANNDLDEHTLVGHYMKQLSPNLSVTAKAKNRYMRRSGESTYPQDTNLGVPDGNIDAIDYSQVRNDLLMFGQDLGFRYTGIQKSTIYGNAEFTESENDLKELQRNMNRVLLWERRTLGKQFKQVYTLGGRVVPSRQWNMTVQGRKIYEDNDFDDQVESSGSINSAFIDSMKIEGEEFATKLTWKPWRPVQTSLRYKFDQRNFDTRVQTQDNQVSRYIAHSYTYDLFVQPVNVWLLNFSYTFRDAKISTPAASKSDAAALPGFNADYHSLLLSSSYTPNEALTFTTAFGKTFSDNFNDFTASGLPMGVTNDYYSIEMSMLWKPKNKDWSIEPHYAYYNYDAGTLSEYGDYSAHVAWLNVAVDW